MDDAARAGGERGQRRARRHDASGVVERAGGHEAQTVRVGRRRHRRRAARSHACSAGAPRASRRRLDRCLGGRSSSPALAAGEPGLDRVGAGAARPPRRSERDRCDSSAATPGLIGSHERRSVRPSTCWNTISSGCSAIGSTDAVARAAHAASASTPANAGATRAISSCTSSTVSKSKSAPKRSASSAAMRQSSIAVPSGVTLRADALHPALEVRDAARPSRPTPVRAGTRRRAPAASARNAPTAITNVAPRRAPARSGSRSGKSAIGSAPSSTSASILPSAAASRMPAASRPALVGHARPTRRRTTRGRRRA